MANEMHVELKESADHGGIQGRDILKHETSQREDVQLLAIASTFTSDLVRNPLECWMKILNIQAIVSMAPYAQVMQALLDHDSPLSKNNRGVNIILMRLEDWIRDRAEECIEENVKHLDGAAREFAAAVEAIRARSGVPIFIFFGPCSSKIPAEIRSYMNGAQQGLAERLRNIRNVHCWSHTELIRLYPMVEYEDARADRLGHIPYVPDYFVAIATLLARRIAALVKPRHKAIAVDCDNTLWKGVCGEEGASAVEITPAHREFQKMLVQQYDAGILLCLCSKNNASDVEAVFTSHPEMPLRQEHLICSRVNWQSKSSNLQSMAGELGLSSDSFIFIDDSPVECAEIELLCPGVLTLQMPQGGDEISHFINHVWAFDRIVATAEARERTVLYRQNEMRARALKETASLGQFLASLNLEVEISMMKLDELDRVTELVHRTNQFNLTTIRRSASEIEALWTSGDVEIAVVRVRDRFGDYGLVGAVFFRSVARLLEVDTLVLSCRALGRGVEHRVVAELGRVAGARGLSHVLLRYRATSRNAPAWTFLDKSFSKFLYFSNGNGGHAAEVTVNVPAEEAERVGSAPAISAHGEVPSEPLAVADSMPAAPVSHDWHDAAYRLSRLPDIVEEIRKSTQVSRTEFGEFVAPRTPMEVAVAKIWTEILRTETVSAQSDFFDLGGDSVLAIQVIARIESTLGVDLSVYEFFETPTVTAIAEKLEAADRSAAVRMDGLTRALHQEIGEMSDEAVRARIAELEKDLG